MNQPFAQPRDRTAARRGRLTLQPRTLRGRNLLLSLAAVLLLSGVASAQRPRLPANKLAADMVSVKRGPRLFGVLLGKDADGNLKFVVERQWLKRTERKYYQQVARFEKERTTEGGDKLLERIAAWRERRPDDIGLQVFLKREQKRLSADTKKRAEDRPKDGRPKEDRPKDGRGKADAKRSESRFLVVDVLANEIRGAYFQQPARRQVLVAAWRENVRNAVGRSFVALARELARKKVNVQQAQVAELLDGGVGTEDNPRQWAARVAIVEYRLRKQLNFEGSGSFLARTGEGAKDVDLSKVLGEVLKDQLTKQLAEVLGGGRKDDRAWLASAIKTADAEGVTGFRVARLEKDVRSRAVTVDILFYGKMPDGKWELLWRGRQRASATATSGDLKKEIASSPEVKRIVGLMRATGLPLDGAQLQLALGFGAATKSALQKAQLQFTNYLAAYAKQLDRPPVVLAGAAGKR